MVAKKLESFGGMIPATDDRLLPDSSAARAENTWLYSGAAVGINQPKVLRTLSGPQIGKVYRIPNNYIDAQHLGDATFIEFSDIDTDIVKSTVVGDTFERYYFVSPSSGPTYNTKARIQAQDAYTRVLLHFEGLNTSTTILDNNTNGSVHVWTAGGAGQIATAQFKFGTSSLSCGGANDYVTTVDSTDYTLGTGDFTVDFWFRSNAAGGTFQHMCGQVDSGFTAALAAFYLRRTAGNVIEAGVSNGSTFTTVTGTTQFTNAVNTGWHHAAFVRTGNVLKLFIDGVQEGGNVAFTGAVVNSANALSVGRSGEYTATTWTGWLDEFRLSVGIARWTANFTAPAAAYGDARPFILGIPTPGVAPAIAIVGGASAINRTSAYVYTWVSAYGEEGPPSPPTVTTGKIDASWNLTFGAAAAQDLGVNRNLTRVRIYRTITSASGVAVYMLVDEQDIRTLTYSDVKSESTVAASSALPSTSWVAPPTDLAGWVTMPNGIVAGFRNNEIWFCEPYRTHAWPPTYSLAVDYKVVGLGVLNQTLVVCTQTYPIAISGVHPSTMTQSRMATLEPCLSRGSIVSAPEGVYYCSANGLVRVSAGQAVNISQQLITKDQWQKIVGVTALATLRGARLAGAYYAYGSVRQGVFEESAFDTTDSLCFTAEDFTGALVGMIIDPNSERVAFNALANPIPMVNVHNDPWTGELFVIRNGVLYWIDIADSNPTYETFTWRTKIFQANKKENFAALKVFFQTTATAPALNPVRNTNLVQTLAANQWGLVRAYADGTLVMTKELRTSGELMRIPSGYKADYWQFEFVSRVKILSLQVASTAKELATV